MLSQKEGARLTVDWIFDNVKRALRLSARFLLTFEGEEERSQIRV